MLKLTFVPESTAILPDRVRTEKYVIGEDATEVLEKWRTYPDPPPGGGWGGYDEGAFRQRIIEWSGAEGVTGQDEDDLILPVVVRALGPEVVMLTEFEPAPLESMSRAELLAHWAATMRAMRSKDIIRSGRIPAADIAESLVAATLGGTVVENRAQKGYDVLLPDGTRVQVKARYPAAMGRQPTHYGAFSRLDGDPFDLFVGVVFDEDFNVIEARQTTIERVRILSKLAGDKPRLTIRKLKNDESDETKELHLRLPDE